MESNAGPTDGLTSSPIARLWSMNSVLHMQAMEYWIDVWQRSILFLDVLRQRGNTYQERRDAKTPHVLGFAFEVILRGDQLERPVNYGLVRITPPKGVETDPRKRPFIVFDPRAGHGPGIGGMKHDSEIGVVLAAGHPCYFVGFVPEPVDGQTVLDVCSAHAAFVRKVVQLHPHADGKPCLIGNCQAGWQIMMMAALNPDLVGPLLLAGSPLSYWAGVHGKNPMRYIGGLWGGGWVTALMNDLGAGKFDGANLVANFEYLDPANTYWQKPYNVHSKIDTEPRRFLEFESWWGSPVLLEAEEMRYIVDELFIGNRLSASELSGPDGVRIDLRNVRSPIIVFCSQGDNITPPQQALGWVLDLYENDSDIAASGQTIIYSLNPSVGHLAIFVSSRVAKKEHAEFVQSMDLMDVLPPGLYEAVVSETDPQAVQSGFVSGPNLISFTPRTLDDIRALGGNNAADDLCFETVARVSEIGESLYQMFIHPLLSGFVSEQAAEQRRQLHPCRLRFSTFSDKNPWMRPVAQMAHEIQGSRRRADDKSPFVTIEKAMSEQIVAFLNAYRDMRDLLTEQMFMAMYGSPLVQACVGLQKSAAAREGSLRDLSREWARQTAVAELQTKLDEGGLVEACVRSLLYVGRGREIPGTDERVLTVMREIRAELPASRRLGLEAFKNVVRRQNQTLQLYEDKAVAAIPSLLAGVGAKERSAAIPVIRRIAAAGGELSGEAAKRLTRIETLFAGKSRKPRPRTAQRINGRRRTSRTEVARRH